MKSKILLLVTAILTSIGSVQAQDAGNQLFELRVYRLKSQKKAELFDRTARDAYLPALKRAGIGPVGVFKTKEPSKDPAEVLRYMLL